MMTQASEDVRPGGTAVGPRSCVVAAREQIADDVVMLTLRDAQGVPLPAWDAGAHIDVVLPDVVRQYSLCGAVEDRHEYRVAVLREPDSRGGSAFVHEHLSAGSTVGIDGPRNHFALEPADRYVFVAGGIGITPIVPMVAAARAAGVPWELFYGGRRRPSMAFVDALTALGPAVHVVPEDEHGLLDLDAALAGLDDAGSLTYCCGPLGLLDAVEARAGGERRGRLRVERFSSDVEIDRDGDQPFELVLARSGVSTTVEPGTSVLEACAELGIDIDCSCTQGVCGTCETVVLEGTPDHRDEVLSEAERESNGSMMVCVSRARSERLVLDA